MQIAVTRKVIPHMQCAFQAVSQQLDTRCFEIRSVARSKVAILIPGLYLIFFQNVGCARFSLSRSHNLVVRLLLALHPGKPWSGGGKCSFTS